MRRRTAGIECRSARLMSSVSTRRMFGWVGDAATGEATPGVATAGGAGATAGPLACADPGATARPPIATMTAAPNPMERWPRERIGRQSARPTVTFGIVTDIAQRWTVGDATITSVVEDEILHLPPEFLFPE